MGRHIKQLTSTLFTSFPWHSSSLKAELISKTPTALPTAGINKWRTKTYGGAEPDAAALSVGTDKAARSARSGEPSIELVDAEDNFSNVKFFGVNGIECESTIAGIKIDGHQLIGSGDIDLTKYATIEYSDAEDQKLQLQIDELGVTKGKVARYTPKSINGGFASRPGEVTFNSGDPAAVTRSALALRTQTTS